MTKSSTVNQECAAFKPQKLIQSERSNSRVDVDQINAFLESSPERRDQAQALIQEIVKDPILKTDSSMYDRSKREERAVTARKIARLALYMEHDIKTARKHFKGNDLIEDLQRDTESKLPALSNKDLSIFDRRLSLLHNIDPQLGTRVGVHLGLFGNCIKGNGTNEQIHYWLQERGSSFMKGIYGCFGMTELGHGSNVARLQTKATYNPDSDTFTLLTPNLPATKFWIGGAANSATHCSVYARLIVEGKDYGVKTFVVPLRNPETFQLLPGIAIGDIGHKMGRNGIDNGWIQFHNVVIPREYMLSRFTQVIPSKAPNGKATVKTQPQLDQISGYSALLSGRVNMVMDSFRFGSKFAIIGARYAVGRQQFAKPKQPETQLIDYPLHQYRVLPQIAVPYLVSPVAFKLMDQYYSILDELYKVSSPATFDKTGLAIVSKKLKNLFIDSASLKATNTWLVAELIDQLRQSCGGQGYSSYNAFGKGYDDWVVQCTWEGDNNILSLSSAKSILKKFAASRHGVFDRSLDSGSFDYLEPSFVRAVLTGQETASLRQLQDYTKVWAIALVKFLDHIARLIDVTKDLDSVAKLLVLVSKFHSLHSMLQAYYEKLKNPQDSHVTDAASEAALWDIYKLFSLYFIDKHSGEFQQFKVFTPDQISQTVQPKLLELLQKVRKSIIPLTDAFKLPDDMINAPIGYFDGDIYHNYFSEIIKQNPAEADGAGVPPNADLFTRLLARGSEFDHALGGSPRSEIIERLGK
ncbi:hypothetical protein ZYGR_0P03390 [Zygosaccharomyces rouxii]|uniref:Acyl-coenzyme A oxidase n=1 Tax=Zygosaccharomyces rouxii TaxID=4956 RepID=A0A1Q3A224_ZYGRO|nr:hypothetical protein ZYGR_0P03390 [Zygosaccharomyces rouxii]